MSRKISLSIALLMASTAAADVAPPRQKGKVYVTHRVGVTNMADHADWVLLVYDAPSKGRIVDHLAFASGTETEQTMTEGDSWRSTARYQKPSVWLLSKDSWTRWAKATRQEIAKQRRACAERGEGCVHISRFQPKYAPPADAIACNATIDVVKSQPTRYGAVVRDMLTLTKAGPKGCTVTRKRSGAADPGAMPPTPPGASPWLIVLLVGAIAGVAAMGFRRRVQGA